MNHDKTKVAVVDDDESFACALERRLRASGFDVRTYPSAEALLAPSGHPMPDCLMLDVHLGGMSGLDLLRHLRGIGSPPPVIFITAHDAPGLREQAEQLGCSAYFPKPVPGRLLVSAITKAVASHVPSINHYREQAPPDTRALSAANQPPTALPHEALPETNE